MSVFKGLQKIVEAAVDVIMVVPDVVADGVMQEWHDPEVESRTKQRLRRVARRAVQGVGEVYKNKEEDDRAEVKHLRDKFSE